MWPSILGQGCECTSTTRNISNLYESRWDPLEVNWFVKFQDALEIIRQSVLRYSRGYLLPHFSQLFPKSTVFCYFSCQKLFVAGCQMTFFSGQQAPISEGVPQKNLTEANCCRLQQRFFYLMRFAPKKPALVVSYCQTLICFAWLDTSIPLKWWNGEMVT